MSAFPTPLVARNPPAQALTGRERLPSENCHRAPAVGEDPTAIPWKARYDYLDPLRSHPRSASRATSPYEPGQGRAWPAFR